MNGYNVAHPTTREEAYGTIIVAFGRLSDVHLIQLARRVYARAYPPPPSPPLRLVGKGGAA